MKRIKEGITILLNTATNCTYIATKLDEEVQTGTRENDKHIEWCGELGIKVMEAQEKELPTDEWTSVKDELPNGTNRYWCNVKEQTSLGLSHYQWNCAYNEDEKKWSGIGLTGTVTHWAPLLKQPKAEALEEAKGFYCISSYKCCSEQCDWCKD